MNQTSTLTNSLRKENWNLMHSLVNQNVSKRMTQASFSSLVLAWTNSQTIPQSTPLIPTLTFYLHCTRNWKLPGMMSKLFVNNWLTHRSCNGTHIPLHLRSVG
eukprot:Lithocolla_globosa_v1_NODE_966_length_3014_cov_12.896249.p4 type:complete len:103 gc:universal NODE_966_length_3014_cov_12.896249:2729-2421(-)